MSTGSHYGILSEMKYIKKLGPRTLAVLFFVNTILFVFPPAEVNAGGSPYYLDVQGNVINRATIRITSVSLSSNQDTDRLRGQFDDVGDDAMTLDEVNALLSSHVVGTYLVNGDSGDADFREDWFQGLGEDIYNTDLSYTKRDSACGSTLRFQEGHIKFTDMNVQKPGESCTSIYETNRDPVIPFEYRNPSGSGTVWRDANHEDDVSGGLANFYDGMQIVFRWLNANEIARVDDPSGSAYGTWVNIDTSSPNKFNYVTTNGNASQNSYLLLTSNRGNATGPGDYTITQYHVVDQDIHEYGLTITDVGNRDIPGRNIDDITTAPTAPALEDNTCEGKSGAWGWFLCSGIDLLDGALNWVDNQIQRLLSIDENKYTNDGLRNAWMVIRNIAFSILIPIMLVMVIGTAIGVEAFSAYTVKRALPRMVVAIIFITLSWYICVFLITMSNEVGRGVLGLITSPFKPQFPASCQDTITLSCLFSVGGDATSGGGAITTDVLRGVVTTAANAASVIGIAVFLVFFGTTLLLGAGLAFIVLLIRQMFIVGLILLAPLAILAWIFPGNDKPWKSWWGIFSKLLMMFPLVMGLIGIGRIFAILIDQGSGAGLDGSIIAPVMKLGAYILPYALIPLTFRFAGGMFANVAGMVNDRNKGLFDRAKNKRGEKWARTKDGNFFRNASDKKWDPRNKVNSAFERGTNISRAGINPRRWKKNQDTALAGAAFNQAMEALDKSHEVGLIKGNEDYLEAGKTGRYQYANYSRDADGNYLDAAGNNLGRGAEARSRAHITGYSWDTNSGTDGDMRKFLERRGYEGSDVDEGVKLVKDAKKGMSQQAYNMMAAVGTAGTSTGYANGIGDLYHAINEASGGNRAVATNMLAATRGLAERSQRSDLVASGFNESRMAMNAQHNLEEQVSGVGGAASQQLNNILANTSDQMDEVTLNKKDPRSLIGAKPKVVRRLLPKITQKFEQALQSGDNDAAMHAASQMAIMRQQMGYYPEEVRDDIVKSFQAIGMDLSSNASVDQQLGVRIEAANRRNAGTGTDTQVTLADAQAWSNEIRLRAGLFEGQERDPRETQRLNQEQQDFLDRQNQ